MLELLNNFIRTRSTVKSRDCNTLLGKGSNPFRLQRNSEGVNSVLDRVAYSIIIIITAISSIVAALYHNEERALHAGKHDRQFKFKFDNRSLDVSYDLFAVCSVRDVA